MSLYIPLTPAHPPPEMKSFFQTASDIHATHMARARHALALGDIPSFNLHVAICHAAAAALDSFDPACLLHNFDEESSSSERADRPSAKTENKG